MGGVVVVTLEKATVIGSRTYHRQRAKTGRERQHTVVRQEHDAVGGGSSSQSCVRRVVEDCAYPACIDIGRLEQAQAQLGDQHPADRVVYCVQRDPARSDGRFEGLAKTVQGR